MTAVSKRILTLLLLWACLHGAALSQTGGQAKVDSLLRLLETPTGDTLEVRLRNEVAFEYAFLNPDEGLRQAQAAMDLATRLRWLPGVAHAHRCLGSNHANLADYPKALEHEYNALRIFEHLGDSAGQAIMLRNIGIVHNRTRNHLMAIDYGQKSAVIYDRLHDMHGVAGAYNNIANAYYWLGETAQEIDYKQRALRIYEGLGSEPDIARMLGNIANTYAEAGEYAKAMAHYFDALRREARIGNPGGVTRNKGNIGETFLDIYAEEEAVPADSLIPAGKEANLRQAIDYLEETLSEAKALKQTEYLLAYAEVLTDAYQAAGRHEDALQTYRAYIQVRDSVDNDRNFKAITRKAMDYEYGKREDSIQYARRLAEVQYADERRLRDRDLLSFGAVLCIVMVFSGFLYQRWQVTRRQKVTIEQEKKRSEELLLNILPADTARELMETGHSEARMIHEVTVLFTDFKGFTQVAEEMEPQALVALINECFSEFDQIMGRHGVEKIKTIGDAYMAAGGLPTPNGTHAVDVVEAALAIQRFMAGWSASRKARQLPYFELRIGIHTGPVVAGIVGTKKFQYDIWGDTVNLAARMESSGEAGKVNISATTYAQVRHRYRCTYRGRVEAKHKGEVDMYFLEA